VERLASSSAVFETLRTLQSRLLVALAPDKTIADPQIARLALVQALLRPGRPGSFLAGAAAAGVRAWERAVDSVDDALTVVRQTGCAVTLTRIEREDKDERARLLTYALAAQDDALRRLGLFDARSVNDVLIEAIQAATPERVADAVGATELCARSYVAWHPAQLALWRALDGALSALGGRALIELPTFDVALDAARTSSALDQLSDGVAAALDDAPVTVPIEARLGDFRFSSLPTTETRGRVALLQAADATVQGWTVGEAVHAAIGRGVAPERIAIVVPDSEEVTRPIRGALTEIGIVAHDPRGRAAAAAPIVAFALRALRVADQGLPRRELANLIRSRYANARALSGMVDDGEARAQLRRVGQALEATPPARTDDPVRTVELTVASAAVVTRASGIDRALPRIAGHAAALLRQAVMGRTRAEHAARARALWSSLDLPALAVTGARELLARHGSPTHLGRAELDAIAYDAQAWETLVAALDEYDDAVARLGMADVPAPNEAFRLELAHILERPTLRQASGRAGAVRLVRPDEVAAEPLDLLVIADFNEGVFPASATLPAFFSPTLQARLRELDARFPTPASGAARALAGLALAACAADAIVLIHRARDEGGSILAPAPVFAWLERGGLAVHHARATAVRARPLTDLQAELRELALRPETAVALTPSAAHRARVERSREAFFSGGDRRTEPEEVGALSPDEAIHEVLVEETGGGGTALAVTSLERLASCPFQGFAAQILGARDWRASTDAPDAREQGSIIHGALAAAFRATGPLWSARPRDTVEIHKQAMGAADAFLEREAASSGLRRLALDEARSSVLRVIVWSLADEAWDFRAAEQPFGDGRPGSWDAVRIERDGSQLALRGAIDRVDLGHGRAAVRAIDYKLSDSTAQRATRGLGQLTFQLPVYARAAALSHAARESTGLYLPTRVRGQLPQAMPRGLAEAWSLTTVVVEGLAPFEARALDLVEQVRAGELSPLPRDKHACDTCSFDGGCRKPRFAISAEREDEPEGR
jgi:hypothetical protein